MKKSGIALLSAAVAVTSLALAWEMHHPNLKDAEQETDNAIHHVETAQKDNKRVEFGGHAEKAIDFLRHAHEEIVEADKWNEAHHK
jgi:hypothetical protein